MRLSSLPRFLTPLCLALGPALGVLTLAFGASAPPGPAEGQKVFTQSCAGCHAVEGKGGSVGPKLDDVGARHEADWLRQKIVHPKFNNPKSAMPVMPLKPRELDAVVAYLVSLKPASPSGDSTTGPPKDKPSQPGDQKPPPEPMNPPEPMPAHEAADADTAQGRQIYEKNNCSTCHKLNGEGGALGPALDDVGSRRDADWLKTQVTDPKAHNPKTSMPATPLPTADLDALVAFLLAQKSSPPPSGTAAPTGPARFVGSAACMTCHADLTKQFQRTVHSDALMNVHKANSETGCESCHGPGSHHAATGDPKLIVNPLRLTPRKNSELCLRCHTGQITSHDWMTSAHSQAGVGCSSCHEVMRQVVTKLLRKPANELCVQCHRREAAEFAGVSHHPVPEGRMQCVDCHNPHSGVNEAMLRQPANDQCMSCHADKQGPFEFEHPVVNGGFSEGCMSCHKPHGSPFPDLRKIAGRGLCLQCHTDKAVGHFDTRPDCTTSGCHVAIHGSHEDPLFLEN